MLDVANCASGFPSVIPGGLGRPFTDSTRLSELVTAVATAPADASLTRLPHSSGLLTSHVPAAARASHSLSLTAAFTSAAAFA